MKRLWSGAGGRERQRMGEGSRQSAQSSSVRWPQRVGVHDLVLTGPYRAISAYGSVSIEIDSPTTNSSSNVDVGISTTTDSIDVAGKFTTDYVRIDISTKNYHHTDGRTTTLRRRGQSGSHPRLPKVPLSQSVVAVPLTSQLLIAAALHISVASSNHTAAEGLLLVPEPVVVRFRPEPSGQEVQRFGIGSAQVEIKVIWALYF
ncbi:unnamed protein product [Miscanthus lutarioriparius]|uniref:Uncharacterized protein n=1 Tax=Miscanthus lutarioriparius TaxID=422564 RepID=A0A811Q896_9POAL|nr:unnamed protein product [Miscanthus lutarioriparius]